MVQECTLRNSSWRKIVRIALLGLDSIEVEKMSVSQVVLKEKQEEEASK